MAATSGRLEDWPRRLETYFAGRAAEPFAWGRFDCCLAACDGIEAMTGSDPAVWFRGRYKTELGALKALARFLGSTKKRFPRDSAGRAKLFSTMVEATAQQITGELNMREVIPLKAQRGDIVLVPTDIGLGLGLIGMDGRFFNVPSIDAPGWERGALEDCVRAWRVG